ncbi:unnamed protein product [Adineta ricciae]|nr:unnamed protein product [Adineta ricciae]
MILNGDFETGTFAPGWQRTQATNSSCGIFPGQISNVMPRTGTYSIRDGSLTCKDKISQTFMATAGDIYIVSYWYKTNALGSGQSILVTLS